MIKIELSDELRVGMLAAANAIREWLGRDGHAWEIGSEEMKAAMRTIADELEGAAYPGLRPLNVPMERAAAWEREDPAELRRSADEWERLGYKRYAVYLRGWAHYREGRVPSPPSELVPRPF